MEYSPGGMLRKEPASLEQLRQDLANAHLRCEAASQQLAHMVAARKAFACSTLCFHEATGELTAALDAYHVALKRFVSLVSRRA